MIGETGAGEALTRKRRYQNSVVKTRLYQSSAGTVTRIVGRCVGRLEHRCHGPPSPTLGGWRSAVGGVSLPNRRRGTLCDPRERVYAPADLRAAHIAAHAGSISPRSRMRLIRDERTDSVTAQVANRPAQAGTHERAREL